MVNQRGGGKMTKQDERLTRRLGRQIQKMRKKASLTQEELALKIKKSVVWVGLIESGKRIPNLKLLYKIAWALNVKVKDLFPF